MSSPGWVRIVVPVLGTALLAAAGWAVSGGGEQTRPELEPARAGSVCVEPAAFMVPEHPVLLNQWRDAVVRDGETEYTSRSGDTHVMSLTKTCLDCHGEPQGFCVRCHEFAGVRETCWDCHVDRPN